MSKFTTVSGSEINYKAKDVTSEVKTWEVEIESEFMKDTIIVNATKEQLENMIEYALEGKNNMFRKKNKEAKQKLAEEEEEQQAKLLEEVEKSNKK